MTLSSTDIAQLATDLAGSGLDELHLTGPGTDIHLTLPPAIGVPIATPKSRLAAITAQGVGVFLPRHPLHAEPLAVSGHRVRAGQIVALLRVGLLLRQVTAPADGIIGAPLVEEGAMVGYGTTLFPFHPEPPESQT